MAKIRKIIGAFIHAPDRFDELARRIAEVSRNLDERGATLNQRIDNAGEMIDGLGQHVGQHINATGKRIDGIEEHLDRVEIRIDGTECRIDKTESRIEEKTINWFMDQVCDDRELLSRLNRGLSIAPTVWGDPARLEIDETAAVFTCFFNTNSGRIRIGESTFAGSGVSLLAGSHDPQLTGFMRRDTAETEGCDIEIGKGVWLASGCMVLGPCSIGDNAVIAAGAVVVPGTKVPAGTIWGGVPARQIGVLESKNMTPENPAVKRAFEHSGGMLFADGWGERTPGIFETPGHRMYKQTAGLITDRAEWRLEYRKEGQEETRLHAAGPAGETEIILSAAEGDIILQLPVREGELGEVILTTDTDEKVFMAWSRPETKKILEETEEPEEEEETAETAAAEQEAMEPETANAEDDEDTAEEKLDIEKIMEEIRAEAQKWSACEDLPVFAKMPKADTQKCEKLKEQVKQLTNDLEIPLSYTDPSRNPLKRAYKKVMLKAVNCATAPMSMRITETNTGLKNALEKAVEVIEEQEKRIAELEKKAE